MTKTGDKSSESRVHAFSAWLDLMRWVAAAVVLISHAGGVLLVSLSEVAPSHRTLPHFGYSFIAGFAHYAVMVFFVMSGYLVGGSLVSQQNRGELNIREYTVKRLVRLWIVLGPTLILSLLAFLVLRQLLPVEAGIAYAGRPLDSADGETLLCNLLFLQNLACRSFLGNNSLWSLFHEFWYYVFFPLGYIAWIERGTLKSCLCFLVMVGLMLALTLLQQTNVLLVPYFIVWLLGVWAYRAEREFIPQRVALISLLVISILARIFWVPTHYRGEWFANVMGYSFDVSYIIDYFLDIFIAIVFANLLVGLKLARFGRLPPLSSLNTRLAASSFSLYCTHIPVLMVYGIIVERYWYPGLDVVPSSLLDWLKVLVGLLACFGFGHFFWWLFERHTDSVRRRVCGFIGILRTGASESSNRESVRSV